MKTLSFFAVLCTLSFGLFWTTTAQSPTDLPLLTIDDLRYLKALAARERRAEAEKLRIKVTAMDLARKRKTFTLSR